MKISSELFAPWWQDCKVLWLHHARDKLCTLQHQLALPLLHGLHPQVACPDMQSAWAAMELVLQDASQPNLTRHCRYLSAKLLYAHPHFRDQHLQTADRNRTAVMEGFPLHVDIQRLSSSLLESGKRTVLISGKPKLDSGKRLRLCCFL